MLQLEFERGMVPGKGRAFFNDIKKAFRIRELFNKRNAVLVQVLNNL